MEMVMSGAALEYINSLLQPYRDTLSQADSVESLRAWVPQVFGNHSQFVLESLDEARSVIDAVEIIINALEGILYETFDDILIETRDLRYTILPWDVVKVRDAFTTRLFGPVSNVVPVDITVDGNTYQHMLTQDFVYGLLSVLWDNPEIIVSIADAQLSQDDFGRRYEERTDREYTAIIPMREVFFNGTDLIRGVATAGQWLDLDPHTLILDLTRTADGTLLTF